MGLRNLPIPTKTVEVADGVTFTVRGFSPNDALSIYHRHRGELSTMFDDLVGEVKKGGKKAKAVDVEQVKAFGANMVSGAPRIMAEIIAIASGSVAPSSTLRDEAELARLTEEFEADVEAALKLSAAVQMDALQKIGDLSFTPEMPPGKFLAVVVRLAHSATAAMTPSSTA
jgi:hypothetical protein